MIRDLLHAMRVLYKQPALTILATLAIAMGIAANAAIFSVVQGVLLRPLPYSDADRLVFFRSDFRGETGLPGIASAEIEDIRKQSRLIERLGWLVMPSASLTGDGQMERVQAVAASDDLLAVLAVTPVRGRSLSAGEDRGEGRPRNLMISHELWQRRYLGDPNIIGRAIEVNNATAYVVGVLPQGFRLYLPADTNVQPQVDIWYSGYLGDAVSRGSHHYRTIARLKNGVTLHQAQAEIDAIAAEMIARNPADYPPGSFRLHVAGLQQDIVKPARTVILVLLCAVGFVLLIACANVANLLLARASQREVEIAVRAALGAGRAQIVRQVLTESVMLAVLGGAAGLLLAQRGIDLLLFLRPDNLPLQENIALNPAVTLAALTLSMVCGILFGLAPAWQTARADVQSVLKQSGRSGTSNPRGNRIRSVLVTAQVALSLMLLIGAILMTRSFANMQRLDLGFDPQNLLTLRVDYDSRTIRGGDTWRFYQRTLETLQAQPGVESASAANVLPFDPIMWTDDFALEESPQVAWTAIYNPVLPQYFHTLRIPLAAGRDFTAQDNEQAAAVVIVDQRFANKTWPGESAIGKKLIYHPQGRTSRKTLEIVGVAQYTRFGIRPDERPQIYVPFGSDYGFFLMVAVRTQGNPATLAPVLRRAIEQMGGKRPVWDIRPMEAYVAAATAETSFALVLLGGLSAVAFVLSVIGVYGVVCYAVAQRLPEFAIRMAVGADGGAILRLALTRAIGPALAGTALGIAGSLALGRYLRTMLFEVSPTDGATYLLASTTLIVATLLACYLPVRSLLRRADPRKFLNA
jgi:putative ABC transport system permease protein